MRKLGLLTMASMRSMMVGLLSPLILGRPGTPSPQAPKRSKHKRSVKRAAWNRRSTLYVPNGERECARRIGQGAHFHQLNSHKPGTVQPRHIFGVTP